MVLRIATCVLLGISVVLVFGAWLLAGAYVPHRYVPVFCASPFFIAFLVWLVLGIQRIKPLEGGLLRNNKPEKQQTSFMKSVLDIISYIPSIIIFSVLVALWAIAIEFVPEELGLLYCAFSLNTVLLFWLLRKALGK